MNGSRNIADPSAQQPPSSGTSRTLLERLRADDPAAWDRMVALYAPLVLVWCRRDGLQEEDAADVFQEVFQSVAAHIEDFRKERNADTFRGWLRTITRNKIRDHFRRRGREPVAAGGSEAQARLAEVPWPSNPEESSDDHAERRLFQRAIALIREDFEEQTWQAFWRTVVEGRAPKDVAAELGMTPGAVRVSKSRVLRRLREELGDVLE
jgi:RNA polymerase sigma-70 factor (ECF subfamily)